VREDSDGDLFDLAGYVARRAKGKTYEELRDEFKAMRDIRNVTVIRNKKHLHELSWNELAHSPMLKQAVLGWPSFSDYNITTARVLKEPVPGNEYGELVKGKMIDYGVSIGPPLHTTDNLLHRLFFNFENPR
jgi:hypothetical protein